MDDPPPNAYGEIDEPVPGTIAWSDEASSNPVEVDHVEAEAEEEEERVGFGSPVQYILCVIGYAVGLGNIWRFPALAYEHGGSAFLIPYLTCSIFFGLPVIALEFSVGQYMQQGGSALFRQYAPAFRGLGITMALSAFLIYVFYNVLNSWILLYVYQVISFQYGKITECGHKWNTPDCSNGSVFGHDGGNVSAAEEFFTHHILGMSSGIDVMTKMNVNVLVSVFVGVIMTMLALMFGVKFLGKLSYVTATTPYIFVFILFCRGVCLEGAMKGIEFYLLKPDMGKLLTIETWRLALSQICFSLGVGSGGLIAMSSYNKKSHNYFKDAVIIFCADTAMSVFGGAAIFSVLGFIANKAGLPVTEVVQSGFSLAFVAYPQALHLMPWPWLWFFVFFVMLALLGLSSLFGVMEGVITCICDELDPKRKREKHIAIGLCLLAFVLALPLCTDAGIYWFTILNDFLSSIPIATCVAVELLMFIAVYGIRSIIKDIREMMGESTTWYGRWFGPSGYYMQFALMVTAPFLALVILVSNCIRPELTYGTGHNIYKFPIWATVFGWFMGVAPLLCIPVFLLITFFSLRKAGKAPKELILVQESHPSYERIRGDTPVVAPSRAFDNSAFEMPPP